MGAKGGREATLEPDVPEKGVARGWTEDNGPNVRSKGELFADRPIKEQHELDIWVRRRHPADRFMGIPSDPVKFPGEKRTCVHTNYHKVTIPASQTPPDGRFHDVV